MVNRVMNAYFSNFFLYILYYQVPFHNCYFQLKIQFSMNFRVNWSKETELIRHFIAAFVYSRIENTAYVLGKEWSQFTKFQILYFALHALLLRYFKLWSNQMHNKKHLHRTISWLLLWFILLNFNWCRLFTCICQSVGFYFTHCIHDLELPCISKPNRICVKLVDELKLKAKYFNCSCEKKELSTSIYEWARGRQSPETNM